MAGADYCRQRRVIRVPEMTSSDQISTTHPLGGEEGSRYVDRERDAVAVLERWWLGVRDRRLFRALKHAICAAERSLTREVLRNLNPREAPLLTDPVLQTKVKFRLSGCQFPPVIVFKIFLSTRSQYISGKSMIRPASEAAEDACRIMGNRKFYDQLLLDTCQHQQMRVTDTVDITTIKDYMKYSACLDESPAYMGGRDNLWRNLTLDTLPRHSQMYNVVDFLSRAHHPEMRGRSLEWISSLSRPPTQTEQVERITAVSSISTSSPLRTTSPQKLRMSSPLDKPHTRERQSRLAQQRVRKMRRAYGLASKEGEVGSHGSVDSRQQQRQGEEEEEEEEEGELQEEDVLDLYQWSQDLSFEELT